MDRVEVFSLSGALMTMSTLFAASVLVRASVGRNLVQDPRIDLLPDGPSGLRRFKIKAAESEDRRSRANSLLKHRYGWRGYNQVNLPTDQSVHKFTLTAVEDMHTIGTITVSFDGPEQLSADQTFGPEVAQLRSAGRLMCEFTKLAIDPELGTKRVLAALFHVAYIVAHRVRGFDMLLLEVNPRHVRYYERMLGLRVLADERLNKSVNAPAVLLGVEFAYIKDRIGELGGQQASPSQERSLYPFAFSLREEAVVISRMLDKQRIAQRRVTDTGHPDDPSTRSGGSASSETSGY